MRIVFVKECLETFLYYNIYYLHNILDFYIITIEFANNMYTFYKFIEYGVLN